jgi:hypothetical protein
LASRKAFLRSSSSILETFLPLVLSWGESPRRSLGGYGEGCLSLDRLASGLCDPRATYSRSREECFDPCQMPPRMSAFVLLTPPAPAINITPCPSVATMTIMSAQTRRYRHDSHPDRGRASSG